MLFHWRLRDCLYPQVFRTLLSILAVLNNAAVWMVSSRPPTSNSSNPSNNPLVTVPKAPITIGIIVPFVFFFFFFFNSLARPRHLSFFLRSFSFILWSAVLFLFFWEVFESVLADGFSMNFEWQQVFSSLQNSSQYSSHSQ